MYLQCTGASLTPPVATQPAEGPGFRGDSSPPRRRRGLASGCWPGGTGQPGAAPGERAVTCGAPRVCTVRQETPGCPPEPDTPPKLHALHGLARAHSAHGGAATGIPSEARDPCSGIDGFPAGTPGIPRVARNDLTGLAVAAGSPERIGFHRGTCALYVFIAGHRKRVRVVAEIPCP